MLDRQLTVLKFGSSVLRSEDDLPTLVQTVYRAVRRGQRTVVVVSALGDTTDDLWRRAHEVSDHPQAAALTALLATGEAQAAALAGMALNRAGLPTAVLDPGQIGLRTRGPLLDADPCDLDREAVYAALADHSVAVVPGFVGRAEDGAVSLLGRGGSDLTAIFLAHRLGARSCKLLKDTDGLYEADPCRPGPAPKRFTTLCWHEAGTLQVECLQAKAARYAREHRVQFEVGCCTAEQSTIVGDGPTRLVSGRPDSGPTRVGLLGLGTVGLGVYRTLSRQPTEFEIVAVAVRDPAKHDHPDVPARLLTDDPLAVVGAGVDLVIECLGGEEPAGQAIAQALGAGLDVVTANKDLIAERGQALARLAEQHGARLEFSAAVGGALPVIERIRATASRRPIRAIHGVLNGTSNFVLSQLAEGVAFDDAVARAQERGFAEADPSRDLDGRDVACKLAILAREAFGPVLDCASIERDGIQAIESGQVQAASERGQAIRLVASCLRSPDGSIQARVRPETLPADHPLAGAVGEENRVLIAYEDGQTELICGKGAGRWPTAAAVVADVIDIHFQRRPARVRPLAVAV